MATTLTLVRHAEPVRGARDAADPGLSARGMSQAAWLARRLACEDVDALYASPLRRASDTAEVIGAELDLEPVWVDDLAEFDRDAPAYVHFEDLDRSDEMYAAVVERGDLTGFGIEAATFVARVEVALDGLADRHPDAHVLAVTHGGVINAYLGATLGLDRLFFHAPGYTSIARVHVGRSGKRGLVTVNDVAHLAPGLEPASVR